MLSMNASKGYEHAINICSGTIKKMKLIIQPPSIDKQRKKPIQ